MSTEVKEINDLSKLIEFARTLHLKSKLEFNAELVCRSSQSLLAQFIKNYIIGNDCTPLQVQIRGQREYLITLYDYFSEKWEDPDEIEDKFQLALEQSMVQWYAGIKKQDWGTNPIYIEAISKWISIGYETNTIGILNPIRQVFSDIDETRARREPYQTFLRKIIGRLSDFDKWGELLNFLKQQFRREELQPYFGGTLFIAIVEFDPENYCDIIETAISVLWDHHPNPTIVVESYIETLDGITGVYNNLFSIPKKPIRLRFEWLKTLLIFAEGQLQVTYSMKYKDYFLTDHSNEIDPTQPISRLLSKSLTAELFSEVNVYKDKMRYKEEMEKNRQARSLAQQRDLRKQLYDNLVDLASSIKTPSPDMY